MVKCIIHRLFFVIIVAYAAVTAIGTASQTFQPNQPVEFEMVITEVGVVTNTTAVFTCPSTAFYFVHYRLLIENGNVDACIFRLTVGQDELPVSCSYTSS